MGEYKDIDERAFSLRDEIFMELGITNTATVEQKSAAFASIVTAFEFERDVALKFIKISPDTSLDRDD